MHMQEIDVDDEVYAELKRRISDFGDSANLVLRRMLGLESSESLPRVPQAERPTLRIVQSRRKKAPKADLVRLIRAGILKEGQRVFLVDHQGLPIPGGDATVRGRKLEYQGQMETMSALTARLMEQQGYRSGAYRGPRHWVTEEGQSIMDLWSDYLKSDVA